MIDITASVLVYYKKERQPIDGSPKGLFKEINRPWNDGGYFLFIISIISAMRSIMNIPKRNSES